MKDKIEQVCRAFRIDGPFLGYEIIQMGNINQTYKVNFQIDGKSKSFLLQNVNTYAFREPIGLMENIDGITEHIRRKSPEKTALHFHHTADRKTYLEDGKNFWRLTNYIPSCSYNQVSDLSIVKNAGKAFGEFQKQLSDYDISGLHETIPGFHNTRQRYQNLENAIAEAPEDKKTEVAEEISYLLGIKDTACMLTDLLNAGELPLRVTHNDTKINNVLFDADTNEALVVIDLDTVMPGLMGHDFGDAIRFGANTVAEDCPEYQKASVNLDIFKSFAEGFLEQTKDMITPKEAETLAYSSVVMTAELAVRFLEDYLRGNPYFKILYPEHNLVRTRCQIALCKDLIKHIPEMNEIVRKCLK